ncbi:MerR family transcriptional regulator [Streptomyces kanamyceticus]|uniref:MerR family transcriptional regulator n=1 Tax=Streptomyces kanamyceticus TaxID=1967 RepID=UPI0037DC2178
MSEKEGGLPGPAVVPTSTGSPLTATSPEPDALRTPTAPPTPTTTPATPSSPPPTRPTPGLSIGQVAEATCLSVHALRFFEREGLFLREIPRSSGGRRVYEQADVDWLLLCGRLRDSGMPIATIREFAALIRSGPGTERDRLALLQEHERDVRAKIDDLNACLEIVQGKVATYEQHLRDGTAAGLWAPASTTPPG